MIIFKELFGVFLIFVLIGSSFENKCDDDDIECHEKSKYSKGLWHSSPLYSI